MTDMVDESPPGGRGPKRRVASILPIWRSQLIDVSGNNRLLFYKDLKVGVVDLVDATVGGRAELLAGREVRPSRLWPDPLVLAGIVKSLKVIERPARASAEEFGLQITHLASGFVTWEAAEGRTVNAPLTLRSIDFRALPGSSDGFQLQLSDEVQINPVLLHLLESEHGVRIDDAELLEGSGGDQSVLADMLTKLTAEALPDLTVVAREVIANFAYSSQSLVEDLGDEEAEFLATNEIVAALAGDPAATRALLEAGAPVRDREPDLCAPSDEHLILDADGSQSYVINAIVAGQHLVVQGPPGTGKTQTIANTIAELVARGKSVLFVAQKRAAITAVLGRLHEANLDGLVLDLFDGGAQRKRVVNEIGSALERSRVTAPARAGSLQSAFQTARDRLVAHDEAMHEIRAPWGLSLLGSKDLDGGVCIDGFYDWALWTQDQESDAHLRMADLRQWDEGTHDELRYQIRELTSMGGLDPELHSRPGWSVTAIRSVDDLARGEELASSLTGSLMPDLASAVTELAGALGLTPPSPLERAWCEELIASLDAIEKGFSSGLGRVMAQAAISDETLRELIGVSGDKAAMAASGISLGWGDRRRRRKALDELIPGRSTDQQHQGLIWVRDLRARWATSTGFQLPAAPLPPHARANGALAALDEATSELAPLLQGVDLSAWDALSEVVRSLLNDRTRHQLPQIHAYRETLTAAGCGPVLQDLLARPAEDGEVAANRLTSAFVRTVVQEIERSDPRLAAVDGAALDRATLDFQQADVNLRDANASRVRRAAADALVRALDEFPEQAERLRGQVKRKRGFLPIRKLMHDVAPDVVLAAKPVWAASPQTVSQLLPARQLFDVVLFDEASQVLPAAAIPSIARGKQVVVAGDDKQLPPTTLFTRTSELEADGAANLDRLEAEDENDGPDAEIPDTESILDALSVKLGTQRSRYLAWHYRSRDERLIATSNEFLYRPAGRLMTTFPAAEAEGALRLERCAPSTGLGRNNLSPAGEVTRVVDLMLEHARAQVDSEEPLSLGVIAFGAKHAARIERELEVRLAEAPEEIKDFFADDGTEKYFIKNIERVQGDERDVIILTIGYAKGTNGKLSYHWGPVQQTGGERRVNVAITRARSQMIVVASFGPEDVDPYYSDAPGFQLMRRFIEYAATGGASFGDEGAQNVPCNTFEADIQRRLEERGLTVIPQYGVGGYRLDFAVAHPHQPGRFVLAVEADGASYHSGIVARERDRLRQRLLEARGWRFVRIWSTDYFHEPDLEIDRVVDAYEDELAVIAGLADDLPEVVADLPAWSDEAIGRVARHRVPPGLKITDYTDSQLHDVIGWILSDQLPRSRADLFEETKRELGFKRDGARIVARIEAAIDDVYAQLGRG